MYFLLKFVVFNLLLIFGNCSTTCQDSQKQFSNLCFAPQPINNTDYNWLITRQAIDGLHGILGNDIARLHQAQALKGEKLSLSDNLDGICLTYTIQEHDFQNSSYGKYFGFDNLTSSWNCKFSKDFPLLFVCDDVNPATAKYHENFNSFVSYTDHANFIVEVFCYPNGEVGWVASALTTSFTDTEKKTIIDHITSLGFSDDNTVTLYNEKDCSPEIK